MHTLKTYPPNFSTKVKLNKKTSNNYFFWKTFDDLTKTLSIYCVKREHCTDRVNTQANYGRTL